MKRYEDFGITGETFAERIGPPEEFDGCPIRSKAKVARNVRPDLSIV